MLNIKKVIAQFGIKQSQLAKLVEYKGSTISNAVISQIVNHNIWPRSIERNKLEQQLEQALVKLGVSQDCLIDIFEDTGADDILADK